MLSTSVLLLYSHLLLVTVFTIRILVRNNLEPVTRLAWFIVLLLLPYFGSLVYFLFGEVDLGHHADKRYKAIFAHLRDKYPQWISVAKPWLDEGEDNENSANNIQVNQVTTHNTQIKTQYRIPFNYAASINGFQTTTNNHAELMSDGDSARERLHQDIEQAVQSIHILYYIWLDDHTGKQIAHALIKAAQRGVECRVMVDGLASRLFIKSALWQEMQDAGVEVAVVFPINHLFKTLLKSRIDLRNHRKITIIDNKIFYCGSQNCADEAFLIKKRYAPWIDILMRFQGSIVTQMQILFLSDWLATTNKSFKIDPPEIPSDTHSYPAQVIGDGPTGRKNASTQLIALLLSCATRDITISTPYFVPDSMTLELLCAAAYRGVNVTMIFPKRNDSWIVAAASRSHYFRLLSAGIKIYEFLPGLLHAKTLTIDDKITFIGSTNLDIRSFNLNYENDVLLYDQKTTQLVIQRQQEYLSQSSQITLKEVRSWPYYQRIWHNAVSSLSPIL